MTHNRPFTPTSALDWDTLLGRCLTNRRHEMFDQIRGLINGAIPTAAQPPEQAKLDQWIERCLRRWQALVADFPSDAPERCPHGYYWFAYEVGGDRRAIAPAHFPEVLQRSVVRHSHSGILPAAGSSPIP